MMKLILVLAFAFILTLTACGGDTPENNPPPADTSGNTTTTTTTTPATDLPDLSNDTAAPEQANDPTKVTNSGYGVYEYANSVELWRYEGEWKNSMPNGQGTVYIYGSDYQMTYTGNLVNGFMDGTFTISEIYKGDSQPNVNEEYSDGSSYGMLPWLWGGTPETMPPTDLTITISTDTIQPVVTTAPEVTTTPPAETMPPQPANTTTTTTIAPIANIIITLDKTSYKSGETINVTIKNIPNNTTRMRVSIRSLDGKTEVGSQENTTKETWTFTASKIGGSYEVHVVDVYNDNKLLGKSVSFEIDDSDVTPDNERGPGDNFN